MSEVTLNALFPLFQKSFCYIPIVSSVTLWKRGSSHTSVSKQNPAVGNRISSVLSLCSLARHTAFIPSYLFWQL